MALLALQASHRVGIDVHLLMDEGGDRGVEHQVAAGAPAQPVIAVVEAILQPLRLIVSMLVRHGKSELHGYWTPIWFLRNRPPHPRPAKGDAASGPEGASGRQRGRILVAGLPGRHGCERGVRTRVSGRQLWLL